MRRLFTYCDSRVVTQENRVLSYMFKYYTKEKPYLPLPLVLSNRDIIPVALTRFSGWNTSITYKNMLLSSTRMSKTFLRRVSTRGNTYYGVGPGCMYHVLGRESTDITPIFVMCLPSNKYEEKKPMTRLNFIDEYKYHMEVFFNNDIRSVNSTLWKYIRKTYIPLLQLEGMRFQFKNPLEIMDLTTTSYQKPKFKTLKEVKDYKEKISSSVSLREVISDIAES